MNGKWVRSELTEVARRVLPPNPRKSSYRYDMKFDPSKYVRTYVRRCHLLRMQGGGRGLQLHLPRTLPCQIGNRDDLAVINPLQDKRANEEGRPKQARIQQHGVGKNFQAGPDFKEIHFHP